MKKILLPVLTIVSIAGSAQTFLTVNHDHFELAISPDSSFSTQFTPGTAPIPLPTLGSSQTWDYSALSTGGTPFKSAFHPSDNNPNFPNASAFTVYNPFLGSLQILGSKQYDLKNTNGWYYFGFETQAAAYAIGSVSGNPTDSLHMLYSFNNFGTDVPYIEYPVTENSSWSSTYTAFTDFELTVASFMLNRTPGTIRQDVQRFDSVVGSGFLSIAPSNVMAYPCLLVKETIMYVDSFFINNQPAPAALLGAFGISQGSTSSTYRYYFVTQDPLAPKKRSSVLSFNLNASGTVITGGSFDNDFYNTVSVEKFGYEMQPKLFPNPVKEDGKIAINFNKVLEKTLRVEIFNMNGSMMQTSTLEMGSNAYSIVLNSAAAGMYFLRFVDENGKIVFAEKIIRQ